MEIHLLGHQAWTRVHSEPGPVLEAEGDRNIRQACFLCGFNRTSVFFLIDIKCVYCSKFIKYRRDKRGK